MSSARDADRIVMRRSRPARVIEFLETLVVPEGERAGERLKLLPFQKRFIHAVYGPHRNGRRIVRRAVLSVGRKNGKSSLTAGLLLAHMIGPEAVPNGGCYSAANEKGQAAIIFDYARKLYQATKELDGELKVVESTKRLVHFRSGSVYVALSRESKSKFGNSPTFCVYDELSQSPSRDLYDALDTAMGAHAEPLFIVISTQSVDPEHPLSKLIDDGLTGADPTTVTHLYTTPDEADIWDEETWKAANPALGVFRSIDDVRALAARAKRMPAFESAFRNLILNQRVDARAPLIPRAEWQACRQPVVELEPGEPVFLGLDLSETTDLCALAAVSAQDGDRLQSWFWKPSELLDLHERRDRAPYRAWVAEGHIDAPDGRSIDYGHVAQRIVTLSHEYDIVGIAYDRWHIEVLLREFERLGVDVFIDRSREKSKDDEVAAPDLRAGFLRLVRWGQGFRDMGPAVTALETSILQRRLRHDGHPVMTWCVSNAIVSTDPAGWRKFDKAKSRFRIDGVVAAAMAIGLKAREGYVEEGPSVYESRGLLSL